MCASPILQVSCLSLQLSCLAPKVIQSIKLVDRVFGIMGLLLLMTCMWLCAVQIIQLLCLLLTIFNTVGFIVLVTAWEPHGHIFGNHVFCATDFKVLPMDPLPLHQHPVERCLLALVHVHLFGGTFWFSYTWNLMWQLQAQCLTHEQDTGKVLWETVHSPQESGCKLMKLCEG